MNAWLFCSRSAGFLSVSSGPEVFIRLHLLSRSMSEMTERRFFQLVFLVNIISSQKLADTVDMCRHLTQHSTHLVA